MSRYRSIEPRGPALGSSLEALRPLPEQALAILSAMLREAWKQWGFLERVTSGLYCVRSGMEAMGRRFLEAAARLSP
jgi:hypothetical protein